MYGMVDLLQGGSVKFMFITNTQAEQIAKNPAGLQKMFDVLEVGKPKLVISFLESRGLNEFSNMLGPTLSGMASDGGWAAGVKCGTTPFSSQEEEELAESRIDMFMSEVLLPLAVQTNAVIFASAITGMCALSSSFTPAASANKAKWGGKFPFSVLSLTNDVEALYCNPDLSAYWRQVRRSSTPWKQHSCQAFPNNGGPDGLG